MDRIVGPQKKISNAEWKIFLSRMQAGETVTSACKALNISRSSPYRKRERDVRFARHWDCAERDSIELLSDFVVKAVLQPDVVEKFDSLGHLVERVVKPPNIYNAIRVLERRHPHWKPTSDVSGDSSVIRLASVSVVDGQLFIGGSSGGS